MAERMYVAEVLYRKCVPGLNGTGCARNALTHDWLGGYPYESTTPEEVVPFLTERGFRAEPLPTLDAGWGFFGTHCDEYVFRR